MGWCTARHADGPTGLHQSTLGHDPLSMGNEMLSVDISAVTDNLQRFLRAFSQLTITTILWEKHSSTDFSDKETEDVQRAKQLDRTYIGLLKCSYASMVVYQNHQKLDLNSVQEILGPTSWQIKWSGWSSWGASRKRQETCHSLYWSALGTLATLLAAISSIQLCWQEVG